LLTFLAAISECVDHVVKLSIVNSDTHTCASGDIYLTCLSSILLLTPNRMVPDAVRKGYAMLQAYLAKQVEVSAFIFSFSILRVAVLKSQYELLPYFIISTS